MIEAAHYQLKTQKPQAKKEHVSADERDSRTLSLIDDFLDSLPKEEEPEKKGKRKPTPADAAVDYVAYLLESETEEEREQAAKAPQLIGQSLIDSFINNDKGKIKLNLKTRTGTTYDEKTYTPKSNPTVHVSYNSGTFNVTSP